MMMVRTLDRGSDNYLLIIVIIALAEPSDVRLGSQRSRDMTQQHHSQLLVRCHGHDENG